MSAEDFKLGFNVDSLMEEARKRTNGLDDLGDGPFMEPLGLFVDSLENEAMLNQVRAEVRELTDAFPLYEGLN